MTQTLQLNKKLNDFKQFYGVFPCDKLPKIKYLPAYLIVNTQPHYMKGEHWLAISIDTRSNGVYFDSYGIQPLNREIYNFLNENCEKWSYNTVTIQGSNSKDCGQFCVLFILLSICGHKLEDMLGLFTNNFRINDEIVEQMFKSL